MSCKTKMKPVLLANRSRVAWKWCEVLREMGQEGIELASGIAGSSTSDAHRLPSWRNHEVEVEVCRFRSSSPSSPGLVNWREVGASRSTALDVLTAIERIEDNLWVITGTLPGAPLYDLQPFWQRVRARAGLKRRSRSHLRHTFASTAVAAGQGLPIIGKLLGHTQVQTTARYAPWLRTWFEVTADQVSAQIASY